MQAFVAREVRLRGREGAGAVCRGFFPFRSKDDLKFLNFVKISEDNEKYSHEEQIFLWLFLYVHIY